MINKLNSLKFWLILVCTFMIISTSSIQAAVNGIGLKDDQYAHIFFSAWATDVCRANKLEWWQTGLVILGLGVAKEMYDSRTTGFDVRDIQYNFIGYAISYAVGGVFKF